MGAMPIKPFQWTPQRPTISPYLQLYREGLDDTLPNYFAFVLPQIEQQELLHRQQLELARIGQQLQAASRFASHPAAGAGALSAPPQNYQARFMNTGGYFSGVPLPQQNAGLEP
jgi:hypothetical protein